MSLHQDKVIVLQRLAFGESDLIVRALNQKGALVPFIAKGALKSRKRFAGGLLEPGHFIEVEYKSSPRAKLHRLHQAWFLKRFEGLRADYDRLHLALHFLYLVEKISQEGVEDSSNLFNLLGNSLQAIEDSNNLPVLKFVFETRLLWIQGVLPQKLQLEKKLLDITVIEHESLVEHLADFKNLIPLVQSAVDHYICSR